MDITFAEMEISFTIHLQIIASVIVLNNETDLNGNYGKEITVLH